MGAVRFAVAFGLLVAAGLAHASTGGWKPAHPVPTARFGHTATLLQDGRVLVVGGMSNSGWAVPDSTCYADLSIQSWTRVYGTQGDRSFHTATLLPSGKVLVVGGDGPELDETVVLYDPQSHTWSPAAPLPEPRAGHCAVLLDAGRVLVAGGYATVELASALLYDVTTNAWTPTASLAEARGVPSCTVLADGRVLVSGGMQATNGAFLTLASVELYDPAADAWRATTSLSVARGAHTATLLSTGEVLVAGGASDEPLPTLATAELLDPPTETWTETGSLIHARAFHTATLLDSGNVLVVGGMDHGNALLTTEIYSTVECAVEGFGAWCGSCHACTADGRCAPVLDGTTCVTGDLCTVDSVCSDGRCTGGAPRDCHADCVQSRCDPGQGCVYGDSLCDAGRPHVDAGYRPDGFNDVEYEPREEGPGCTCAALPARAAPASLALALVAAWAGRRPRRSPP